MNVKGVEAVPVTRNTTCLRGVCTERFKYEIEYGLKRGTTDNCYVIKVRSTPHQYTAKGLRGVRSKHPCVMYLAAQRTWLPSAKQPRRRCITEVVRCAGEKQQRQYPHRCARPSLHHILWCAHLQAVLPACKVLCLSLLVASGTHKCVSAVKTKRAKLPSLLCTTGTVMQHHVISLKHAD